MSERDSEETQERCSVHTAHNVFVMVCVCTGRCKPKINGTQSRQAPDLIKI